jgi:hypothetical protein
MLWVFCSIRESHLFNQDYAEPGVYAGTALDQQAVLPDLTAVADRRAGGISLTRAATETAALAALVGAVLFIHGYHPWSDDAAIYIAGLRKMMQPSLFPGDAPFVLSHTRVSVFSHLLAFLADSFHLSLAPFLLSVYLVAAFLFLLACRRFAQTVFGDERISWIATLFAAACYTLPTAGTAIFVMDPYLSARSFSTPLSIFAVTAALQRRWRATAVWAVLTAIMHPQMGVFAAGFIVILILGDHRRWRAALALSVAAVFGCGALWLATRHAPVTAAYREAVLSRTYFFPWLWQWYEFIGLAAPLVLLAITWRKTRSGSPAAAVAGASVLVGCAACVAAFSFVHTSGPYLLARVQLLRSFQVVYVLGLVLLGGWIARTFAGRYRWVVPLLLLGAAAGMYWSETTMYPGSQHWEWPGSAPENPWGEALVWIRHNTPPEAVFAISPDLLAHPAEDLPGFRALAERSVLVDNKDEGVASVFPEVAPEWKRRSLAAVNLAQLRPDERAARLSPYHVSWLLLPPSSTVTAGCPYRNSVVAVCPMTR